MEILQKKSLFWDIDPAGIDLDKNGEFIIGRILSFGDIADFKWAFNFYGAEKLRQSVKKGRLDPKSQFFWQQYFNLSNTECSPKPWKKIQSLFWRR